MPQARLGLHRQTSADNGSGFVDILDFSCLEGDFGTAVGTGLHPNEATCYVKSVWP
ncbi:MAG: hypothetical protein M1531_09875 [Chloroflexi bacterium]|nr:hypothetical protein [Chloroflexota bacterium]